ncbi:MAG TPA: DUF4031 domain-containing protein [Beutenbergiaceae bacterium]|nr:DUF4031 domain-containing protein [Beutenbergiaceae bacterium]
MALFIDPPRWPNHGTVFSHLVSDRSLQELHAFATGVGLHPRTFDQDHCDVPQELYDQVVEHGAIPVSGSELIRRLRASGLRLPARDRGKAVVERLRRTWREFAPMQVGLGEELLALWSQPHRAYHTPVHLAACLDAVEVLATNLNITPPTPVVLAMWFHDAVYDCVAGEDEDASADLAHARLQGDLGKEVARLVRLTKTHETHPDDRDGAIVIDADLSILAANHHEYWRYVMNVRKEYAAATDPQWREGREHVLRSLLNKSHLFTTPYARENWEVPARQNLQQELEFLTG